MLFLNQLNTIFHLKDVLEIFLPIIIFTLILVTLIIFIFESKGKGAREVLSAIADVATIVATGILISQTGGSDKNKSEDKDSDKKDKNKSDSKSSSSNSTSTSDSKKSPFLKSFSVLALLSGIEPGSNPINQFAFFTLFASLVILSTSINIILYYSAIYLINKGDYENKYPRLGWIVRRYKNTSNLVIIVSIISFYISTLTLIIVSFKMINL
jgi:hypothetical protein